MTHSKILEAQFTTFKELREEFIKAAELVGLTIIRHKFGKEFLNISEEERPSDRPEFDRIFTSSDLSDIHVHPSDRKNIEVSKKGRKIYIKLSDGETTFPPLGDYKRSAQYGLLAAVDLLDSWAITIRKNEHGSFKIVKGSNISIIEVDLKLGIIIVLDTPHKEKVKEPSSDRSVLPNIQSSGCFEEIKNPQKKPFTETPKVYEDKTSHSLTAGIEKANHLMEERNAIIESLVFSRISEGGSTIFDTAAAERLKQLFVPGEDVYSALLHYHSRLTFYSLKVGFESPLLSDLKAILYAGMPKTYLEFDEKVDKEIVFLFAEGGEKQRSK